MKTGEWIETVDDRDSIVVKGIYENGRKIGKWEYLWKISESLEEEPYPENFDEENSWENEDFIHNNLLENS